MSVHETCLHNYLAFHPQKKCAICGVGYEFPSIPDVPACLYRCRLVTLCICVVYTFAFLLSVIPAQRESLFLTRMAPFVYVSAGGCVVWEIWRRYHR